MHSFKFFLQKLSKITDPLKGYQSKKNEVKKYLVYKKMWLLSGEHQLLSLKKKNFG